MIRAIFITILFFLFGCNSPKEKIPTLRVYTYDAFSSKWGPGPKIKDIFEKKNHCKIEFVSLSSSIGALRKIELEGDRTKADILLGIDTQTIPLALKTGLFTPHNLKDKLDLPYPFESPYFTPFDYSYFAFVYDSSKLKNPPHSFEELASMPKSFKIAIQDPRSSTSGFGLLLWIKSIYKEGAKKYWQRLAPYVLTVTKGWSESYNLFLKGEADMVLSYTTSPAYHMINEKNYNIKAAHFKEGHFIQIEVAGILKSSKNKKLAKKFLSFLHSKEFANIIPTTNWTYPVIKTRLPKEFDKLIIVKKPLYLDPSITKKHHEKFIKEWIEAMSGR
ncbi:MAG: thiamine ABC transporter substrate binding subunit [Sulfurospirillum sp.]|nr:MAG: thiamine ABC transporter substrate binding subunit [Sulfurospirillum sp.]